MILGRFGTLRIAAPPGVYRPRGDTALLADALGDVRGARVLELCAGSGALALTAASRGAAGVVAVDRSRRAVATIRVNARLNGLRVDARLGDLLHALEPHERFDVVLANPPYLPVAPGMAAVVDDRWDAGTDGRDVLDRIIDGAARHLSPGGRLVLVQSHVADIDQTCERLATQGFGTVDRVEHRGRLGPILAARCEALARAGTLVGPSDEEILAVVTASVADAPRPALAA